MAALSDRPTASLISTTMKTFYMRFGSDPQAEDVGFLAREPPPVEGSPECACCGEATALLFQLRLGDLLPAIPRDVLIKGFQCRDVGEGGMPAVYLVADRSDHRGELRAIPVAVEEAEDPDDAGALAVEQLDRCFDSKVSGLFVHAEDPGFIPACGHCGLAMALLFHLSEQPADFNFADRDLVVFFCARGHELELTPLLL